MKQHITSILVSSFLLLFSVSCSSDEPGITEIRLSETEVLSLKSHNDAAFKFTSLCNEEQTGNFVIAPYSICAALSMHANHLESGPHFMFLKNLLGFNDLNALNILHRNLLTNLPKLDSKTTLKIANSVWNHPDHPISGIAAADITKYYHAPVYVANLTTDEDLKRMNDWCKRATDGLIPTFIEEPVYLATLFVNANYFKSEWSVKFDPSKTKNLPFETSSATIYVPTMTGEITAKIYNTTNYISAIVPYGNGTFRMNLVLPNKDFSVEDVLKDLQPQSWKTLQSEAQEQQVIIYLPKFKFSSDIDLIPILNKLGMASYAPGTHPFKTIDFARNCTYIETDENGTTAATIAGTGDVPIALPPQTVKFDRPFVFFIDEKSTGLILFSGVVRNPLQ